MSFWPSRITGIILSVVLFPTQCLSLACRFEWAFYTCSLAICQNSLLVSFRVPRGDQSWGEGWCEWGTEMSLAYLGRFAYEKSQGLIGGPPSGVIIRILFLWCFPNLGCCSSGCSLPCRVVQLKAQDSTWSEREIDIFGSVLDNWRSHALSHRLSLFTAGEIMIQ